MSYEDEELNRRRQERERQRRQKEAQRRLMVIALLVTAIVLVSCLIVVMIAKRLSSAPQPTQPSQTTVPIITTAPTEPPPSTAPSDIATEPSQPTQPTQPASANKVIHFVAGGDINVTDKTVASGLTDGGYNYSAVFMDVLPLFANAQVSALNLEGNVAGEPFGTASRSVPAQMLTTLKRAGVDFIQAANSATIYNGLLGMRSHLEAIRSAGMEPLGAYATPEEFRRSGGFVIREVDGIRIAFVAFTKGMDGMGLPEGNEECVNLLYKDYNSAYQKVDDTAIADLLTAVNNQNPDLTIALLHWGSEYNSKISATQEKIRDLMLQGGVDVIIGTHSHYVQEVNFDPNAGTLIAYSLGDLLGDAEIAGTDYSVILDIEITKDAVTGKTSVTGYEYTPICQVHDEDGSIRIMRIRPAIDAYEGNALGKVSKEIYAAMKSALGKIEGRMK